MQNAKSQNVKIPLQALQMLFLKTFKSILQHFAIKLKLFFLTNHLQINKILIQNSKKINQKIYLLYSCHLDEAIEGGKKKTGKKRDDSVCVCVCV